MNKPLRFSFYIIVLLQISLAAQTPVSLRSDVTVQFVMNVHSQAARVAKDPVSHDLFYITSTGDIYEIKNIGTSPYDQLVYTKANHGIDYLQGLAFMDSTMFVVGNYWIDSTFTVGYIKKAVLQPSGSRVWSTVAYTQQYQQSWTWYDHGYSGIAISPDKSTLYINSGSRTDHGEEQNNYGAYPGLREVPLTSVILKIPSNANNLYLPNDSVQLLPYIFADGTRNSFDLAFDGSGNLFGTENSGDRDDPDELNWLRQGHYYGFPWNLGGDNNPQQYPGYSASSDAMLNPACHCAIKGYYYNDPAFPPVPNGLTFTPPIKNMGPDGDKYRTPTGQVQDGSVTGNYVHSFTPHRCPLGLEFDRTNLLSNDLKGGGFMLSFTRGGDSTGIDQYGYPGTVCDPGQDLMHIALSPDGFGEYQMQCTTIVNNFDYPVDSYLDQNTLYVIEYAYSGSGRLFAVNLPLDPAFIKEEHFEENLVLYPNPSTGVFEITYKCESGEGVLSIRNLLGNVLKREQRLDKGAGKVDMSSYGKGIYFVDFTCEGKTLTKKVVID